MSMLNPPEWDGKLRRNYQQGIEIAARKGSGSMTKQSFKDEVDVKNIVRRYLQTGVMTHVRANPMQYGDFTTVVDYQQAMNSVLAAQDAFMTLPAKIRTRFNNDPGQFLQFVHDPNNIEEARQLGLLPKLVSEGGTGNRLDTLQGIKDQRETLKQGSDINSIKNDQQGAPQHSDERKRAQYDT